MATDPNDVFDHDLGKVRVLSRRCDTCIFWPGNLMRLPEGRCEEVVEANLAAGALLTCHATLPYGEHPDFGPRARASGRSTATRPPPAGSPST